MKKTSEEKKMGRVTEKRSCGIRIVKSCSLFSRYLIISLGILFVNSSNSIIADEPPISNVYLVLNEDREFKQGMTDFVNQTSTPVPFPVIEGGETAIKGVFPKYQDLDMIGSNFYAPVLDLNQDGVTSFDPGDGSEAAIRNLSSATNINPTPAFSFPLAAAAIGGPSLMISNVLSNFTGQLVKFNTNDLSTEIFYDGFAAGVTPRGIEVDPTNSNIFYVGVEKFSNLGGFGEIWKFNLTDAVPAPTVVKTLPWGSLTDFALDIDGGGNVRYLGGPIIPTAFTPGLYRSVLDGGALVAGDLFVSLISNEELKGVDVPSNALLSYVLSIQDRSALIHYIRDYNRSTGALQYTINSQPIDRVQSAGPVKTVPIPELPTGFVFYFGAFLAGLILWLRKRVSAFPLA